MHSWNIPIENCDPEAVIRTMAYDIDDEETTRPTPPVTKRTKSLNTQEKKDESNGRGAPKLVIEMDDYGTPIVDVSYDGMTDRKREDVRNYHFYRHRKQKGR